MADWGDSPPTFDRSGDAWGSNAGAFGDEGQGGGEQYVELIGSNLWVAGMAELGRFRTISDMVNIIQVFMVIKGAVLLARDGEMTTVSMPDLRVLIDDVAVVACTDDDQGGGDASGFVVVEKASKRLVAMTRAHIVAGDVLMQVDRSIMDFIDATDPKFIPMTNVEVRWTSDGATAGHYPFALLQRTQILGVAPEGSGEGGTDETRRNRSALRGGSAKGDAERQEDAEEA